MTNVETETSFLPEAIHANGPHRRRHRRSRRFRWFRRLKRRITKLNWRVMFIILFTVTAIVVMSGLVLSINARNEVNDSWVSLSRVLDTVNNKPGTELTLADFERLQASVNDLNRSLGKARGQTSFLRPLTFLSADLETLLQALDATQELTFAANDTLSGIQPAVFLLTGGEESETVAPQLSAGERIVEKLTLGRGRFLTANIHLAKAKNLIDNFDLANISPDLLGTIDGLSQYHSRLQDINEMLLNSPDLLTSALGLSQTQTYLILSQNSDELRPSGGYVSTYGWMTVRNGRIVDYDYSPTTITSPNPPPESMAADVAVPEWWIQYDQPLYAAWDGSWYADFPSTAQMAAWYYDAGGNPQSPVDGVFSIDTVGFEYIMEGLGGVTVPEYNETITSDTFRQAVYRIRAEGEGELPHKQFIAALYRQILEDWQSLDQDRSTNLRGAVLKALQEKHIMVYFTDAELNRAFEILGWLGQQKPGLDQDYLMVADANLGNKSNRSVLRQLTYDVEIMPDGSLHSRTSVAFDYSARVAEQDPAVHPAHYNDINYNNRIQVFTPAGSILTGSKNLRSDPETVNNATHTIFTALTHVNYNESERFQFSYNSPVLVEPFGPYRRYKLMIQKQPGTLNEPINVQVTLPVGTSIVSVNPEPATRYQLEQPILEFRLDLLTDQEIEIIFSN
ncbi:MAG: DUF4012 domain-containing protein [Anaerolineae bacterium]|nr:DUF4012 domain-containing protein [Anaerolineae bacterium]